jgi:uncharacterized protein (TIGR02611 family)
VRAPEQPGRRWLQPIRRLRDRIHRLPGGRTTWRVGVALIGLLIVIAGVILLPLPGPGWLIIFLGIGVWATEFVWAERLLGRTRDFVRSWAVWVGVQPRWLQAVIAGAGFVLVAGVAVAAWLWYQSN